MRIQGKQIELDAQMLRWTTTQTTAYQANVGEIVVADLGSAPFTITAPANPSNNEVFAVKAFNDFIGNPLTIDSGTATNGIESTILPNLASATILYSSGAMVVYQYHAAADAWLLYGDAKLGEYIEAWVPSGLPQDIVGIDQDILFSFVPLYTGQVPGLVTYAAGVFTLPFPDLMINVDFNVMVAHDFASQNQFSDVLIDLAYVGTGVNIWPQIAQGYPTSRTATVNWSSSSSGVVEAEIANETFSLRSNSGGTMESLEIIEGLLTFIV